MLAGAFLSKNFKTKNVPRCVSSLALLLQLYLDDEAALGVALVRQREAEGAARLTSLLLRKRWDPPDEEAGRGEDGPRWSLLQLEEERRALWV